LSKNNTNVKTQDPFNVAYE